MADPASPPPAGGLAIRGLHRRFHPDDPPALDGVDLDVAPGRWVALMGPSGCGKSTLLRVIAGLERADRGTIRLDGVPLDDLPPHRRGVAWMGQQDGLLPHLTVAGNLALSLTPSWSGNTTIGLPARWAMGLARWVGLARDPIPDAVREVAEALQLTPLLHRRPAELSGGQARRVALGRTLVRAWMGREGTSRDPRPGPARAMLLDEPFTGLDADLRRRIGGVMRGLPLAGGLPVVLVTHDPDDAAAIAADEVRTMGAGKVTAPLADGRTGDADAIGHERDSA